MVEVKRSKLPIWEFAFILLFSFFSLNPKMNAFVPMHYFLILELAYTAYVSFADKEVRGFVWPILCCAIIIALLFTYTTSIDYISETTSSRELKSLITMTKSFYSLSFPIIFTHRLILKGSKFQRISTLLFVVVILSMIMHVTMTELAINPYLMKSQMEVDLESGNNALVGGYHFVCAGPLLATSAFYAFLRCHNYILKFTLLFIVGYLILFLIKSQYSIALLAGLFGICVTLICNYSGSRKMLILFALIILWFLLPYLIGDIINLLDDGDTKSRMIEIQKFFSTGNLGNDDLGARIKLYERSITCFFSSPLWGNYKLGFNPHSTLLNIMASIGVLGVIPFSKILYISFHKIKLLEGGWSIMPSMCSFMFMCLTNPINNSMALNISLWLICPLLFNIIEEINSKA